MRDMFRGYYQPSEAEVAAIWRDGLITVDTNILLSLYNVLPSTSALYLGAMEDRKRQMWVPYQVASEFHRNVHKERSRQTALHAARISKIKSLLDDFRSTTKKSRLQPSSLQEQAAASLEALKDELENERKQIAKQTHHHTRDTLLDRIAGVFEAGVGAKPATVDLERMFEEGAKRFEQRIPPGYEDEKDKKDNRKYGDYVLWRQLMDHALHEKRNLIFVTDDNKADWWLKDDDRKTSLAPRPELVQEFREVTGQEILILNSEQFYYALVPAADDNSDKTKQVKAAQEDMKAAVSEAQETSSIYEKLVASLGNLDAQQLASTTARINSLAKKYMVEPDADELNDRLSDERSALESYHVERARTVAEEDLYRGRQKELERRIRSEEPDSEIRQAALRELLIVLERINMLRDRRRDLERLI